ncbi:MAG TPA: PH domain-containing protein [Thermoplasmata archaeon]|nr:PH domain-containing protein [Thermoplasmata archaeon]
MAAPTRTPRYLSRRYLAQDEQVLAEVHASRLFFFTWPAVGVAVMLAAELTFLPRIAASLPLPRTTTQAATVVPAFGPLAGNLVASRLELIVLLASVLVASWYLFLVWRKWASTLYVVTNDRLIKQRGFLYHDTKEIALRQVHSVDVYRHRLGRVLIRAGTLQIRSLASVAGASGNTGASDRPSTEIDPYMDPRDPWTHEQGAEWWFSISNPIGVQRTIEDAIEKLEEGRAFGGGPSARPL